MPSFSDIEHEIQNVMDAIDAASGDLDEASQIAYEEYIGELAQAESDKVDNFGFVIKALTDRAKNRRELANQILAKARADESAIERLKTYYLASMREHGLQKVKGEIFSLSRRACASVAIDNIAAIPAAYKATEVIESPDKRRIADAIKAGEEIPGARLEWNDSLQVR